MTKRLLSTFLVAGLATMHIGAQQPAPVTPADAAPFLGEWTLALEGPNGPGTFNLMLKVENEKILGEIANEMVPAQAIANVSMANKSLRLTYTFPWEGNPIDAVVTLTPAEDGKTSAQIDFAGGAYTMSGTATKKEKAK
jgi:uncharacterized protein YndB with AHSA1/START domain